MNRCIIIGSGLGGLMSGVILAKNGYKVTILERGHQIGGCLQCFTRDGVKFETGMHFIGSADRGQTIDSVYRYFEISDSIELKRLDTDGYNIVSLCGSDFKIANGEERFIETLSKDFPDERDNLKRYFDLVKRIASASSLHSLRSVETDLSVSTEYQLRSMDSVLESIVKSPLLQNVLAGDLPLYAAERGKTPFASHAFIMDFYNQSAFRFAGGSDTLSNALVNTLKRYGGEVLTDHKVTKIVCNDERATSVIVNDSISFDADIVISDAHPLRTMEMLDTKLIRPSFRSRLLEIPQTISCFTVYLRFKENTVPYMNCNYFGYNSDSVWGCGDYNEENWPKGYLYMHLCHEKDIKFANSGVIISYMRFDEVKSWADTFIGRRGESYLEFKKQRAERLINSVAERFPLLKDGISSYYTSTPLTYRDYFGYENGGMYGIAKDINFTSAYRVSHKTKIPNLFFTGQNVNSHGMLGVLVGSIVTCSEMIPSNEIYKQFYKAGNKQ